jgi:hypothetical protein
VIFLEGGLRKRLEKIQEIKNALGEKNVDVKQILLKDLFSPAFFARTGVIFEGISVKEGKPFAQLMGFTAATLFWYTLEGLKHSQKVTFNYVLAGRGKYKGFLQKLKGERLANGAVKIPAAKSLEFEEILQRHKVRFKKKDILEVA